MSYPVSLDEVPDDSLLKEVIRRGHAVDAGQCPYCGYKYDHSDYPKVGPQSGLPQEACLRWKTIGRDPILLAVARAADIHEENDHTGITTFLMLRAVNNRRMGRWHGDSADWSGADWSNAMNGEAGEMAEASVAAIRYVEVAMEATIRASIANGTVANTIKKIRRHETGLGTSYNTPELEALAAKLAEEIADVVIYADLLANHYGIDLGQAVVEKFNKVSEANGFPERLGQ